MKQKMTEMQQKMQDQQEVQGESFNNNMTGKQAEGSKKTFSDDYIEFEEIK